MSSIDNRIVEMQFNNKDFEKNIAQSIKSIDEFERSLSFDGAVKGFQNLDKAASSLDLSPIVNAIENAKNNFTALEIAAYTVFSRITNSAIDAGKRMYNALFGGGVKAGFEEYETQINAVQTILANTSSQGTTLEQVNAALDELNLYADKTIYNFTQMTRNIGTFTAAGVDLDTSTAAIKGIANLAAVSGSTSEQASRAMYQLSQALAAGKVNLQDWNSVVNAGMGGKIFQDSLVETANAMGICVDLSQGFRESLSNRSGQTWLTSEVLLKTLQKFTGDMTEAELAAEGYTEAQIQSIMEMGQTANDAATKVKTITQLIDTTKEAVQSGWTQSWEYILGDFEEAKEVLTAVSQAFESIIQPSAEARNKVLKFWHDSPYGRASAIQAIKNIWTAINDVINPVKMAFQEMFPSNMKVTLVTLTSKFRNFTATLIPTQETTDKIYEVSKKVFSVMKNGITYVKNFATVVKAVSTNLGGVEVASLNLPKNFEKLFDILSNVKMTANNFTTDLKRSVSQIGDLPGVQRLVDNIKILSEAFSNLLGDSFSYWVDKLKDWGWFQSTESEFDGILGAIDRLAGSIANFLEGLPEKADMVADFFSVFGISKKDVDETTSFFDNTKEKVDAVFNEDTFGKAKDLTKNMSEGLAAGFNTIDWTKVKGIVSFAGVLVALIQLIRFVSSFQKIAKMVAQVPTGIVKFIKGTIDVTEGIGGLAKTLKKSIKNVVAVHTLTELAVALIGLSLTLVLLSTIPKEDLYRAVVVFGIIGLILAGISKLNIPISAEKASRNVVKIKNTITVFNKSLSAALLLGTLAVDIVAIMWAVKTITDIGDAKAITFAFITIGVIMLALGVFVKDISKIQLVNVNAIGGAIKLMLAVSAGVYIIAKAMKTIAGLDPDGWKNAMWTLGLIFGGFALLIGLVVGFSSFAKNETGLSGSGQALMKMASAMILIGVAINVMTIPILALGAASAINETAVNNGFYVVSKTLIMLAGVTTLLSIFIKNFGTADLTSIGTTFILMAAALTILMIPIGILGTMDALGVKTAKAATILGVMLIGIGAVLAGLSYIATKWMKIDTGVFQNIAIAIFEVATAMVVIAAAIALFTYSGADWEQVGQMATLILVVVSALTLLSAFLSKSTMGPTALTAFGIALAGLGIAFIGFGAGLLMVSKSLPGLTAGLPLVSKALDIFLSTLENHMGILILGTIAITAFAVAIGVLAYEFAPMLGPIFTSIGEALTTFGTNLSNLPLQTKAIIIATILGIISALGSMTPDMLEAIRTTIAKAFLYVALLSGTIANGIIALIVVIMYQLSAAIIDNSAPLAEAIRDVLGSLAFLLLELLRPITDAIAKFVMAGVGAIYQWIVDAFTAMAVGILTSANHLFEALTKLAKKDYKGAREAASKIENVGELIGNAISFANSNFKDNYDYAAEEATKLIGSGWESIETTFKGLSDKAKNSSDSYLNTQKTMNQLTDIMQEDSDNYIQKATSIADNYAIGNKTYAGMLQPEKIVPGSDIMVDDKLNETGDQVETGLVGIVNRILDKSDLFNSSAEEAFSQLGIAMDDEMGITTDTMIGNMDTLIDSTGKYEYDFHQIGEYMNIGMRDGWMQEMPYTKSQIVSSINSIAVAGRRVTDEHSPSKVWAKIGRFMILGLSVGADDAAPKTVETFTNILSQIADAVDIDIETTPTISPVLDMTNLQNGISRIPSMLNSQSYRLAGINTRLIDETKAYREQLARQSVYNDSNVVESIKSLQQTTEELGVTIENMQMVTDTGALIGAITPGIDKALGTRAVRKGRGN